ncbi:hypothetical protein CYMTET_33059 [Cymbomonas tetramitiformis]|uniref:Pectin acetylesterase n=1 Tax=Cymbomonas tetramitiformis TaxID=36881 RepID=A0AAE0KRC3_9CHLO|nr:hypothetical protein CYMTET_33059 [Cymbomonas tetramitiformis]
MSGLYFPGPVVEYAEYAVGAATPINSMASGYLTDWFASALDTSCTSTKTLSEEHSCWDASVLYEHINCPVFIVENRFDQNQISDVLLCPTEQNSSKTQGFVADYGKRMRAALAATVQGPIGISKA